MTNDLLEIGARVYTGRMACLDRGEMEGSQHKTRSIVMVRLFSLSSMPRSSGRLPSKAGSPQACSVTSLTPGPKALGNKHSNFDHSGYFHLLFPGDTM